MDWASGQVRVIYSERGSSNVDVRLEMHCALLSDDSCGKFAGQCCDAEVTVIVKNERICCCRLEKSVACQWMKTWYVG